MKVILRSFNNRFQVRSIVAE